MKRPVEIDRSELRKGLSRTRQYVLSHHERSKLYRCYSFDAFGREVHICARCSGIYPGIFLGFLAYFTAPAELSHLILVGVLPLPALLDWVFTSLTERRGYNVLRTSTGILLGCGYGLGLALFFLKANVYVPMIGLGYGVVAVILLYFHTEY